jgi:ElaB/YqjD/DUF883 family membrane-anchored ribosome-binding protein
MRIAAATREMSANEQIERALLPQQQQTAERDDARTHPRMRSLRHVASALPHLRDPIDVEGPSARLGDLARAIARRIEGRPFASIVVGLGIGFVVGGALSFRAGRIALAAAARHVAREVLKQVL